MKFPNTSAVLTAIFLAVCLGGCSDPPRGQPDIPAPTQPPVAASPRAPAQPASATASVEGEVPGLRVGVQELKRTAGGTLTLTLVFANTATKNLWLEFGDKSIDFGNMASLGGVNLVDITGKKKYFVARDSERRCLCSSNVSTLDPGARANMWAKFPAPPEDVQKITVMIPHFPPLEEVPISQ